MEPNGHEAEHAADHAAEHGAERSAVGEGGSNVLDGAALERIKDLVVPLARDLGRWAQQRSDASRRGEDDLGTHAKTTPGDVVTEADVEVQRRLFEALTDAYPSFGFLGEEDLGGSTEHGGATPRPAAGEPSGATPASVAERSSPTWVIDPIDGTHNFVRAYPGFCVSVGLVESGESVLGVIYDAATDSVYWAFKGGGAWRDGSRLHVAADKPLDHALLTTGFTTAAAGTPWQQRVFVELASGSAGMRQSGSSCRDLSFVTSGNVDLFWQFGIRAWDVAAGIVMVTEAGGAVRLLDESGDVRRAPALGAGWVRQEPFTIVAGVPSLVERVTGVVERHAAERFER